MRKWKCVSVNESNKSNFTVGKVYKTDDNRLGCTLDDGYILKNTKIMEQCDIERGLVFKEITNKNVNLNRKIYKILVIIITIICLSLLVPQKVYSSAPAEPIIEPKLVKMTYYTHTGNPCLNEKMPREGVCAYQRKYVTKNGSDYTAIVYSVTEDGEVGELIGYFEIYDTGYGEYDKITDNGEGTITNGNTIDIFRDSHKSGRDFISKYGDKCYIQVVKGVG